MAVYHPRPSRGRWWLAGIGAAVVALGLWLVGQGLALRPDDAARPVLFLAGFSTAASSLLLFVPWAWFPSMRYELDDEHLSLRCGPVRYTIRLADVTCVSRRDLALSLWSAMRVPGFALGEVPYAGVGTVNMCSTRALRDIVLVETPRARYGLTPAATEDFLRDLEARLGGVRRAHARG